MKTQLIVPDRIKVGFQSRDDTYTKKLGYVVYYDSKGVLRKEKSWESWRDKKIEPAEFDNAPTAGFVINRNGGGGRGWDSRNEFVRVYDPRNFEFEISLGNLLFILANADCSRGKGLEGKFLYAWDKTSLVLLPEGCEECKAARGFTALQEKKVKAKELVPGLVYLTKQQRKLLYLGRLDYHQPVAELDAGTLVRKRDLPYGTKGLGQAVLKQHVFVERPGKVFECFDVPKDIAEAISDHPALEYPTLVDAWLRSTHGSPVAELFTKPIEPNDKSKNGYEEYWVVQNADGSYLQCQNYYSWGRSPSVVESVRVACRYRLVDGVLWVDSRVAGRMLMPGQERPRGTFDYRVGGYRTEYTVTHIPPTGVELWVRLESGAEYPVQGGRLIEKLKLE